MKTRLTKSVVLAAASMFVAGVSMAQSSQETTDSIQSHANTVDGDKILPFTGVNGMRTWSVGFYGGGTAPFGFPNGNGYYFNNFNPKAVDLVYGGYIQKQLSHNFGLQANFMRGTVKGKVKGNQTLLASDRLGVAQATDFKTTIDWAASLNAVYTFGAVNWLHGKTAFIPYVSVGGGSMRFKTANNGETVPTTGGKSYRNEFYLPVGFGAKFVLSNTINLDVDYKLNFVNARDFDGISGGGFTGRDQFSQLNLGLEFALGSKGKPQLMQHNPAHALAQDLWDKNEALKAELAAEQAQHVADVNNLQSQLTDVKTSLIDTDGDGVADAYDKCPNTPSGVKVDGAGCPLPQVENKTTIIKQTITKEDKEVAAQAVKNLEFDFGKASISSHSYASLDRLADLLNSKDQINLKLAGYTDNVGSAAYNLKLSKDRANSVKSYLISKGVDESRIQADGYGKENPIASNKTEAGRAKNRRVEFTLF